MFFARHVTHTNDNCNDNKNIVIDNRNNVTIVIFALTIVCNCNDNKSIVIFDTHTKNNCRYCHVHVILQNVNKKFSRNPTETCNCIVENDNCRQL